MKQLDRWFFRAIDIALVGLLAAMTLMVFGNVVLRYGFGSGLDFSEEMSRFCFVWLIFLGSVAAMRRNLHMGFDMVVVMVRPQVRRVLLTIANGLILACCLLLLVGTLMQWHINATNIAPVTGMPMSWLFGVAVPMSLCVGIMAAIRMVGYATGRLTSIPTPHGEVHE
ncbi:TRAP transporter small permease [Paracoccus shanxieyensis]|uniref:TRAP transporter small permease protein n=1 Tax=Paracoccus shanxieyensis TaxID=2675752 RepID=A0A6L6J0I9_9RHOB|nr:TRAP transporter small permease [Paracoccus shanxieyensis]MTH64177.1 TRAP transporter small permease subunit [Paracoccus shanxieyensis]MTH87321.1 TRAP transporter small permease subunit [Paracoccus shanxieyensis]